VRLKTEQNIYLMSNLKFTTVDTVLAKLAREIGDDFHETDAIEMIGEALAFMQVFPMREQAIAFLEVRNNVAALPNGFHELLQVARDRNASTEDLDDCACPINLISALENDNPGDDTELIEIPANTRVEGLVATDCHGNMLDDYYVAYYRPFFDLQYEYFDWVSSSLYRRRFTPVRLANHSFFGSVVYREKNCDYTHAEDEYTIIGTTTKYIKTSFEKGRVAVAYTRVPLDPETGYPLVPDHPSVLTALAFYVKWKIADSLDWNGREGFARISDKSESRWLKYVKQAKNNLKMPKSIDEYQNLLEATHHLIPNQKRAYNYFGQLGRREHRGYFDPDYRDNRWRGGSRNVRY
jgi:hypothetical protein